MWESDSTSTPGTTRSVQKRRKLPSDFQKRSQQAARKVARPLHARTSKRCLDCRRRRKTFSTVPWGSCSRLIAGKRLPLDSSDKAALFFFLLTLTCLCTLRVRFAVFLECSWKLTWSSTGGRRLCEEKRGEDKDRMG